MSFQYYETLQDKSKQALINIVEQIVPSISNDDLSLIISDVSKKSKDPKVKSGDIKSFVFIGEDQDKKANFSNLTIAKLKKMFQIFISREINDRIALKWRFYQYLKINRKINLDTIQINERGVAENSVNFVIKTKDDTTIFVIIYDILNPESYAQGLDNIIKFSKDHKIIPDRILIVAKKSHRTVPIDEPLKIDRVSIEPELWIEWVEERKPYKAEDALLIEGIDTEIAGFNFTSMDDLLDYVYKITSGGQVSISRHLNYFSEEEKQSYDEELIWKGIMFKNKT